MPVVLEVGIPKVINGTSEAGVPPVVDAGIWVPTSIDHDEYFNSDRRPDDRLAALGINTGVATGIVMMAYESELVPPGMARRVRECLGFLSSKGCIIGPWASPILRELGLEGKEVDVPTQDEFEERQRQVCALMVKLETASQ